MSSKEDILNRLKANSPEPKERPKLDFEPISFENKFEKFQENVVNIAAAQCFVRQKGESIDELIHRAYPEAKTIASSLQEVKCATINPEELDDPRELNGVDVGVVKGEFGVIENGAVWIPKRFRHKAILFISEALVILLDRKNIVNNMHEAYAREGFDDYEYGCFIAGPSKTADIEQALVIGAHGARAVTVILL